MNRDLGLIAILLDREGNKCLRIIPEEALELHDLLLSIGMNALGQADFFLCELEFHSKSLLS